MTVTPPTHRSSSSEMTFFDVSSPVYCSLRRPLRSKPNQFATFGHDSGDPQNRSHGRAERSSGSSLKFLEIQCSHFFQPKDGCPNSGTVKQRFFSFRSRSLFHFGLLDLLACVGEVLMTTGHAQKTRLGGEAAGAVRSRIRVVTPLGLKVAPRLQQVHRVRHRGSSYILLGASGYGRASGAVILLDGQRATPEPDSRVPVLNSRGPRPLRSVRRYAYAVSRIGRLGIFRGHTSGVLFCRVQTIGLDLPFVFRVTAECYQAKYLSSPPPSISHSSLSCRGHLTVTIGCMCLILRSPLGSMDAASQMSQDSHTKA
ncbi:hypothetical protein OF83DRAFT_615046 [Amylostereum chailletii]|nr:hypothetical protein OF83DRAFT_615046 [Amylostereum chailletii]